jgi:osmoprotectant transport system ATP-binding protein
MNAASTAGRAADRTQASAASLEFRHVSKRYGSGRVDETPPHSSGDPSGPFDVPGRRPGVRANPRAPATPAAVEDLSFTIPSGAICVLVGPSGCGKTTSLKMVNRLIEPSAGQILLDGEDVTTQNVTELRRRIGYVIQQVGLFPHLTVGENVAVVPSLQGWSKDRKAARTLELLSLVGLDPAVYERRYPSQLSGGERQRVGVARALAADPPLMLMDEPFAAVDPIARERLQDEFLRLQRELAKTILFVTHDIDEAVKMGDLIAVMNQGRLVQFGPPDRILAQPASDFVAALVGADRGLKRLSLRTIRDLEPEALDGRTGLPEFEARTKLRDALSALLAADTRGGIALDDDGRPRGLVTVEAIATALNDELDSGGPPSGAHGEPAR